MSTILNTSLVKKIAHGCKRRCSPEFLSELNSAVEGQVRKLCEANGKPTLVAESVYALASLAVGAAKRSPAIVSSKLPLEELERARIEAVTMKLGMRSLDEKEFRRRIEAVIESLDKALGIRKPAPVEE